MTIQEALQIVIDLARQNVIDERELPEENARQVEAINVVEDKLVTHKIDVNDLTQSAISYGEIYNKHLELARSGAKLPEWVYHIETNVIPLYRKAIHEPRASMNLADAMRAARELSDYYKQHIIEM